MRHGDPHDDSADEAPTAAIPFAVHESAVGPNRRSRQCGTVPAMEVEADCRRTRQAQPLPGPSRGPA